MMAKSDKIWADAVRRAVKRYDGKQKSEQTRYLNLLADQLVKLALDGDTTAMKEIGDRLDGKPTQSQQIDMTVNNDVASFLGTIGVGAATRDGDELGDEPSEVCH